MLCLRLRCHVLEGAKATVAHLKENLLEVGSFGSVGSMSGGCQQDLNTVVSPRASLSFLEDQLTSSLGPFFFFFFCEKKKIWAHRRQFPLAANISAARAAGSLFYLSQLLRLMTSNARLEQKINTCVWVQKVLVGLVLLLTVLNLLSLYLVGTSQRPA